jgi:anti-sigma factor RsiW
MTCNDALAFLAAYLDEELGVADAIRVEQHLTGCAVCRDAQKEMLLLRSDIQELGYRPPPELARRVREQVRQAARSEAGIRSGVRARWLYWAAAAAAVLIVCAILITTRSGNSLIAEEIVDGHIRSLQAGHLVDVPSSDRHTVKPWFQGKLDFAPTVPDLTDRGWVLQGGRLDYVGGRAVAALVYQRRKHEINVFVWPNRARAVDSIRREDDRGYHLLHWDGPSSTYWIVSDLDPTELLELARALRGN